MFKKTKDIYIIPFDKGAFHADTLFSWFYDERYNDFFRDFGRPLTRLECEDYPTLAGCSAFMVCHVGESKPIGLMTLHDYRPAIGSIKGGVMMAHEFQDKGLALQALWILMSYAFQTLRLNKFIVEVCESNGRILKLVKEVGADHEGTFTEDIIVNGKLETVLRYALRREKTLAVIETLAKDFRG